MAYMSDIDLATLHKTRLEEKVNYKLSWWANTTKNNVKQYSIDGYCNTKSFMRRYGNHINNKKKPVIKSSITTTSYKNTNCKSNKNANDEVLKNNKNVFEEQSINKEICDNNKQKNYQYKASLDIDDIHDDGYFSSETRRRRSGTWP